MPQPHGQVVVLLFPEDQPTSFLLELPSPSTSAEFGWDKPCQEKPPPFPSLGVHSTVLPCLTPCDFAPCRFQGAGILQWHL